MVPDCRSYYQAKSGDTCSSILTGYYSYLTLDQFVSWNPAVGTGCSNMQVGYYYCMATANLGPQPGTISTCKKYYRVKGGDSCWSIEQSAGITAESFNTWNPDVGSTCTKLWVGYYVCIGV
jgi:hypothetical protein